MIKRRYIFYILSTIIFLFGGFAPNIFNINYGIDLKGGQLIEIRTSLKDINFILKEMNISGDLTKTKDSIILKTRNVDPNLLLNEIKRYDQNAKIVKLDEISPSLSGELVKKSHLAILFVLLGIGIYITIAFWEKRGLISGFLFGIVTVITLFHDVIGSLGVFTLLSHIYNFEFNINIIIAFLLVASFSTHDTIVVFDRLRENLKRAGKISEDIFENSIRQTIVRSTNISLTIILSILPLLFLIENIKPFALVLIIGTIIGTYSSLFLATPLVYDLTRK
ncbi:MAG: protein translocase subunit SecF [Minisyncoccia bacterium]